MQFGLPMKTIQFACHGSLLNMPDPSRGRVIHFKRDTDMAANAGTDGCALIGFIIGGENIQKTATRLHLAAIGSLPEDGGGEYPKDGIWLLSGMEPTAIGPGTRATGGFHFP